MIKFKDMSKEDNMVWDAMAAYPMKPGQMLILGPLSVAYLTGDYQKAPWLMPNIKPPGGNRLPDKFMLERHEWEPPQRMSAKRSAKR